jgi:hypothetical protein
VFGVTIVGCFIVRMMLISLNKKLEEGERAWETQPDVAQHTVDPERVEGDEALKMVKGFRYLV